MISFDMCFEICVAVRSRDFSSIQRFLWNAQFAASCIRCKITFPPWLCPAVVMVNKELVVQGRFQFQRRIWVVGFRWKQRGTECILIRLIRATAINGVFNLELYDLCLATRVTRHVRFQSSGNANKTNKQNWWLCAATAGKVPHWGTGYCKATVTFAMRYVLPNLLQAVFWIIVQTVQRKFVRSQRVPLSKNSVPLLFRWAYLPVAVDSVEIRE